jgi:hypothetical protein
VDRLALSPFGLSALWWGRLRPFVFVGMVKPVTTASVRSARERRKRRADSWTFGQVDGHDVRLVSFLLPALHLRGEGLGDRPAFFADRRDHGRREFGIGYRPGIGHDWLRGVATGLEPGRFGVRPMLVSIWNCMRF